MPPAASRCGWNSGQEGCTLGEMLLRRLNWQRASIAPSGNCAVDTSYVPTSVALFLGLIHHGRALASNCALRADSIPHVWKCIWQRHMPESLSWLYLFVLFFTCALAEFPMYFYNNGGKLQTKPFFPDAASHALGIGWRIGWDCHLAVGFQATMPACSCFNLPQDLICWWRRLRALTWASV